MMLLFGRPDEIKLAISPDSLAGDFKPLEWEQTKGGIIEEFCFHHRPGQWMWSSRIPRRTSSLSDNQWLRKYFLSSRVTSAETLHDFSNVKDRYKYSGPGINRDSPFSKPWEKPSPFTSTNDFFNTSKKYSYNGPGSNRNSPFSKPWEQPSPFTTKNDFLNNSKFKRPLFTPSSVLDQSKRRISVPRNSMS